MALVSLTCMVMTFLPFAAFKSFFDSLMADGSFKSLNADNIVIFRALTGTAGIALAMVAYGFGTRRLRVTGQWFGQFSSDAADFLKYLRSVNISPLIQVPLLTSLLLAGLLRLLPLNDRMVHDEAYTFVVFSSTSIFNITTNYHLPNNHILNSLLIHFSTQLFGMQPWAVRLPAFLAGVLLVPATYALARALYDPFTALFSAILVAVLPGAILYSTFGRGYSLIALFTVLSFWLANYLVRHKNLFAWSLLVLFSALGFYTVPVMLFPFGIAFVWLFFENLFTRPTVYRSQLHFLKHWLVAGISTAFIVLILYTPVFIYSGFDKVIANPWVQPSSWQGYFASFPGHLLDVWREWTDGLPQPLPALLAAGFGLSLIFHRHISHQRFPLQIAALIWLVLLVLFQRPAHVTKMWVFLQAPFMIWSAAGIMGLLKGLRLQFARNVPVAAVLVGFALILTTVYTVQALPGLPSRWAEKGAVEITVLSIKNRLDLQDLIIIDAPEDASFWYYARLHALPDSHFNKDQPFRRLFVVVSRTDGQTLQSVLRARGPDPESIDLEASQYILNHQHLDTYLVPHR
jgi:4-amino-4-deoxy-L-arabinose transferase-like glycosyltransferase